MDFQPDEKLVLKCVQNIEGLADSTAVLIRGTEIKDDVPVKLNNTSKVVKLKIEYEVAGQTKKACLAVKVPFLRAKMVYEFFNGLQFFAKEALFYKSIAPRMQKMLGSGIAPTLFAWDERQVLYLDDVSVRGYRIQAEETMDKAHCKVVMQHMARMHAASHLLHREDPQLFDELIKRQYFISDDYIGKLYIEVGPLLRALARVQCLSAEMVERFDKAVQKARKDISEHVDGGRVDFSVLNHGDLKANNILVQYDEQGKPARCSFVDFQICSWSSPLLDIIFYTILSMEHDVFVRHFDEMLNSYLSAMNATFEELKSDVRLTKAHLRRDWDELKAIKIFCFLFRTTIDIRFFCNHLDFGKYEEASPEMLEKLAQSNDIQGRVRFWLEEFQKTAVF